MFAALAQPSSAAARASLSVTLPARRTVRSKRAAVRVTSAKAVREDDYLGLPSAEFTAR